MAARFPRIRTQEAIRSAPDHDHENGFANDDELTVVHAGDAGSALAPSAKMAPMSWVAVATARYDEMRAFYGGTLGCPTIDEWERPHARACVFDLNGLRLEVLDATRERGLALGAPADRVHLVLEVADVDAFRRARGLGGPPPRDTSWGARILELRDPDGLPVTVLARRPAGDATPRPPTPTG